MTIQKPYIQVIAGNYFMKKTLLFLILISFFLISCSSTPPVGAGEKCDLDTGCISGFCVDGICSPSEFGGVCQVQNDCGDNFCLKDSDDPEGQCVNNNLICKAYPSVLQSYGLTYLISLVGVVFFVVLWGTGVLNVTAFSWGKLGIGLIVALFLGLFILLLANALFEPLCMSTNLF